MTMYGYREDTIKHIKRSLRGKKDTWHVISFNYSGYHVAAKCYANWVQRVYATELDNEGNQSVALRDNQEIILQDSSAMDITQKACVEFFERFLACLDEIRTEERAK